MLFLGFYAERMRVSMEEGILSDEVESTIASIRSDMISSGTFQSKQVDVAVHILERNVEANLIFDTEATENMRQAAAAEVEEVTYQKGQNIVQKGEVVSEAQVALINELGLNNNQDTIKNRFILSFGMMAIIFVIAYLYLLLADRHLLYSVKLALNIVIMTALSVGLAMVVRNVDLRFLPAFLPIILAAAVFDTRTALAYSIFADR